MSDGPKDDLYTELCRRKAHTRLSCDICGTDYKFDSLNMCKNCASVVCYKCVWHPETPDTKRQCQCGGTFDER